MFLFIDQQKPEKREKKAHYCYHVIQKEEGKIRCWMKFPSKRQLDLHKKQQGHIQKKQNSKATAPEKEVGPKKQLKLSECFVRNEIETAEGSSDEENEPEEIAEDDGDASDSDPLACDICKYKQFCYAEFSLLMHYIRHYTLYISFSKKVH